jgi:hypothetical protein
MKDGARSIYRLASLVMAVIFAVVGLVFLVLPDQVLGFFNHLSPPLGLAAAPVQSGSFYPILAVAYMYMVTLLAWWMFRKPGNPLLPLLLAQAKFASAMLSLAFFFAGAPYLICLANAVVDGGIGALVLWLYSLQKKHAAAWST